MANASNYCPYNSTSSTYDLARRPLDIDDLITRIETLAASRRCAVSDLKLLDIGAGSGNYYAELRKRGCMIQYHGLEGSQGMIDQFSAKEAAKDESARGIFSLQLCDLTKLPLSLDNETFDVCMITQVIHHLSDGKDDHCHIYNLNKELGRVITANGGFMWLQTSAPEQQDGFWWSAIIPIASAKLSPRFPPNDKLIDNLSNVCGFDTVVTHIPDDPLMSKEMYLDYEGAFKEEWRNCDSTWALNTSEELEQGLAELRILIDNGSVNKFMEDRETRRNNIGQTTTVVATKA